MLPQKIRPLFVQSDVLNLENWAVFKERRLKRDFMCADAMFQFDYAKSAHKSALWPEHLLLFIIWEFASVADGAIIIPIWWKKSSIQFQQKNPYQNIKKMLQPF